MNRSFADQVTEARRQGDVDKEKAILGEIFKLLRNSAYGKLIDALERHTKLSYTTDEATVDRALRSAWFKDLNEVGAAYELESLCVRPELRTEFEACRNEWLAWDKWSKQMPGVFKRHNALTWERYKAAAEGAKDLAKNRGFRMVKGTMRTYEQTKLGLSANYDKRRVLPDGIHTKPLEYALRG
ncbi:hypothetical protein QZH41_017742 [Actinostola sp. cb2023]|nr:hypothetical protein QZH41_017742 [Actinostola sp. cb2023]